MSDTNDHLTDEATDMLAQLRAAQDNAPPMHTLVNAVGAALERKNKLIAILAEAVISSDCRCPGCVQMREIVCNELEVQVVHISLDPETLAKCMNTMQ
jgi:hypothetical protein